MKRKISIALLVFVVAFVSFYCQKKARIKGVGLEVTFSEPTLSDNLITDVQYKWKIEKEFKPMGRDYVIFVHFWHKNNMLLQDDYTPDLATSKWEPGKEYTYTRRIYIPPFIDEFDPQFKGEESLRLAVGFYSPYDRSGKSEVEVFSKKLKVLPPPLDAPEVIYESGWYDLEINPEAFLKQWRWSAKEARCVIDNPHRDALLVIKGGVNLEVLKDQKVIFKINDLVLDEFIPAESAFEKSYNIKKEMLGDKDEFSLLITTDKTFIPAKVIPNAKDERELGVQISFIYFR
jgi:hypothetical protein